MPDARYVPYPSIDAVFEAVARHDVERNGGDVDGQGGRAAGERRGMQPGALSPLLA